MEFFFCLIFILIRILFHSHHIIEMILQLLSLKFHKLHYEKKNTLSFSRSHSFIHHDI